MGRSPCCAKEGLNKGAWTALEDKMLVEYVETYGEGKWRNIPKAAGLKRCGKSCRLRWLNYLRPDIKRGNISPDEEDLIIRLHKLLGNRWSLIAGRLPGRTDNEIKNYWNTNLSKKVGSSNKSPKINQQNKQPSANTNQKSHITDDNESGQGTRVKVASPVAVRASTLLKSSYISKENDFSNPEVSSDKDSWTLDDVELSMDFNVSDLIDFAEFGNVNIVFGIDHQSNNDAAGGASSTSFQEQYGSCPVPESDFLLPGDQMAGSTDAGLKLQSNDQPSCFASLLFDPSAVEEDWLMLDGDGGSMFGIF